MNAITIPSEANDTEELNIRVNAAIGIITWPMILGPRKHIKRIAHRLGAHGPGRDFDYPIHYAKRRSGPPVFVHIRSGPDNDTSTSYECYLAFQTNRFAGITLGDSWYVGTPLFNSNCPVLDFGKKRIGFATPKRAWEM
ncbi:hypothetical protein AAVH_17086 [Aphelenchoides avenae]|nr:hypothetical protein AAVH_17086 [Aphelenchus avenae]